MGVVEVQRVGQRAVDERGGGRRQRTVPPITLASLAPPQPRATDRTAAAAGSVAGGERVADQVEHAPALRARRDRRRDSVLAAANGEFAERLDQRRRSSRDDGERTDRRARGADDLQRREHEDELVHAVGGQALQVEHLHDVDPVLHQQHDVDGQQRVTLPGGICS